ncbi:NBR1-Ig-like domain-containing protein [Actinomadura sp. WMMA1423]|uniref:NBR1-Ig-like domain-containing protein n=1 Tax=Actinomadura sp. WMMA1423 TaxID=2591108 RepID=UPI0011463267|nr:NBR1-Ig-like domain-containing protein [Actinomadura sp. WMMA1423]
MSGAPGRSQNDRARAIEDFAAELRALRASVGTPSFREMAGRSRAISHTTLHEAAQGNRLPSWATTGEFVKACGADPEVYRERWTAANRLVRAAGAAGQAPPSADAAPNDPVAPRDVVEAGPATEKTVPTGPTAGARRARDRGPQPEDERRRGGELVRLPGSAAVPYVVEPGRARRLARSRRRYAALGVLAAVVAAAALIGDSLIPDATGNTVVRRPTSASPPVAPSDCPVRQRNPPPRAPAHEGDQAVFMADVTLPDCSRVVRGARAEKVWRFRNGGTVAWRGYSLHRVDLPQSRGQCQTIVDVPIPETPPGGVVDIRTQVTAPPGPAFCFVRFKMLDGNGAVAFPGNRPVNFQLIVK